MSSIIEYIGLPKVIHIFIIKEENFMFSMILEEGFEELDETALLNVNGGACTGSSSSGSSYSGGCTSYSGGSSSGSGSSSTVYSGECTGTGNISSNGNDGSVPYIKTDYPVYSIGWAEGLGLCVGSVIKTTSGINKNGVLSISATGYFSAKNNVESYNFCGNADLIIDGKVVETKKYSTVENACYDANGSYVGVIDFDTKIPTTGSVSIRSDIDLVYGITGSNGYLDYSPKTINVRQ